MVRGLVYFNEIEEHALKRSIPVMQKDGIEFLIQTLIENNCKACLEIGSAIGYSAMMIAKNIDHCMVETIEIDNNRFNEAKQNIENEKLENQIILHHFDALEFDVEDLQIKKYDCLFIDAAKAQYQKFFEKFIPFLNKDGICIVDNLDFHGMIHDIDNIKNRNTKQLVKKIKRFKDWIFDHSLYEVTYYAIGDGICIIKRR